MGKPKMVKKPKKKKEKKRQEENHNPKPPSNNSSIVCRQGAIATVGSWLVTTFVPIINL